MSKLWGGRFGVETDKLLEQFNASIGFDRRLYYADIMSSIAYARALRQVGILSAPEVTQIVRGLQAVLRECEAGAFQFLPSDEDIHTAVERRLHELIGDAAGKLHTGRSRNDQIATDVRLYLLGKIGGLRTHLRHLQRTITEQASAHIEIIMPGYTHLQPAQPVLFAHWLMSFFWMLQRDRERLDDLTKRVAVLPLGSGALAGNSFAIDRVALALWLDFVQPEQGTAQKLTPQISENSLDAVADRDFVAEFLFWAALLQTHLSRLAEDLIIYSTAEFGFVELDDAYSTGSSLMPQKKNPDPLELTRAKTGRLLGNLVSLLTTLKGLPSAYDKDLQEDKEPLFDTIDTLEIELPVLAGVIGTLRVNSERMAAALRDEMLATDLTDYLVRRGIPFRESHHLVGRVVRAAMARDCTLRDLELSEYQAISPAFAADVYEVLDFRRAVEQRAVYGGTATSAVREQIARARVLVEDAKNERLYKEIKNMDITREQAWALLNEYTKSENLIKHALAVEAAMRAYARRFGEDEEKWAVVGLIHDFDYEKYPTAEDHPFRGAEILREHGWPEELIETAVSHANYSGIPRDTKMKQALAAVDELTGLITAVALVRPSKSIMDVKVKSVKKKWRDKSFAAGANRADIEEGAALLGIDLWEHVGIVLEAMKSIAPELGLAGQVS